jgi:hypothetical protein
MRSVSLLPSMECKVLKEYIRQFRRCMALVLAATLFFLVGGCAVTPETRAKSAPGAVQITPGQGLLALKITANRLGVGTFFGKWHFLRVRNLESQEIITIGNRADSSAEHSLFVQGLSSGTYQLESVNNMASGAMTLTQSAKATEIFPTFKIADGQLTDLGALAYVRKHYPINTNLFRWGQVESPLDRQAVLRQLDPALATQLKARPVISWDAGDQIRSRRAVYDESRVMTMRALSPTPQANGSLLFGESFGQIAIRSASGVWRWLQTSTALPIRAIHVGGDGAIYAGSDDGVLLIRRTADAAWEPIQLPVNDASVIDIGYLPGSAELLVVLQTRDRFLGLSVDPTSPGGWKEHFSRPRALFLNEDMDARGAVLRTGEKLLVITGSVESNMEVIVYSASDRNWRVISLNETGFPVGWASMHDGHIGKFNGRALTGIYFSASADNGITWKKLGDLNLVVSSSLFVSERTGYVIRANSMLGFNSEKPRFSVWRTDDAGQVWTEVGPLPTEVHGKLIALNGNEKLGYVSADGQFFVSSDGAKTWQLEREVP